MDFKAYGQAVIEGGRSILSAAQEWRTNPLATQVNRTLWSTVWQGVLLLLVVTTIAADQLLPSVSRLVGFVPPLIGLAFFPDIIRDCFYSAPAFFGFVVVWRMRTLRSSQSSNWLDRTSIEDFGGRFFDAAALPIAIAALLISVGTQITSLVVDSISNQSQATGAGVDAVEIWTVSSGSSGLARTIVIIALVTGVLGVHRRIGTGLGKLLGAGFLVWGIHIGIGYAVPFMTGWATYLPVIGRFAPERSAVWAHSLFDLAVACAAWIAAREKWRGAPLWSDGEPTKSPPPPPPPPPPTSS